MRRADFFLVEAVRALRNNLATTVAATVTVLIVLYFLGVFVLFGTYLYAKVDKERSGVRVTVYLDKRATKPEIAAHRRPPAPEPRRQAERRPVHLQGGGLEAAQAARPEGGVGERPHEPAAGLVGGVARQPEPRQGRRRGGARDARHREGRERRQVRRPRRGSPAPQRRGRRGGDRRARYSCSRSPRSRS